MTKVQAIFATLLIVLISGVFSGLVASESNTFFNVPLFAIIAASIFIIQWIAFIPAYKYQTEVFYDLTGSVSFLFAITLALGLSESVSIYSLILAVLIGMWAVRLGSFLFNRVIQDGKDSRFDNIKPHFFTFLFAWTMQGFWVLITLSAALAAMTSQRDTSLGYMFFSGLTIWCIGMLIEITADNQKQAFRNDPENKGSFVDVGLWAHSRHPNYFGEILIWTGIAIIAFPALSGWLYLTLISPIFVTILLTKVSGIPMLEEKANERWGDDPNYQEYKAKTPLLVPSFTAYDKK
ncbi:DUF1295 domain-containing protein [Aestuariibacter sp. AA17]|uniref:DUF1295 domain-containing protein n=1 Tax=Fluctibacter corallii TaxID=2984329 RepID=A0ABT3A4B2_9ALTE|nr:DUF1295 domain-containing protein [Aestuariibacter sp. AA17]MCV2883374.1 DUF1295 domain-containing protein [Aestuariibacter sp. AA17]